MQLMFGLAMLVVLGLSGCGKENAAFNQEKPKPAVSKTPYLDAEGVTPNSYGMDQTDWERIKRGRGTVSAPQSGNKKKTRTDADFSMGDELL